MAKTARQDRPTVLVAEDDKLVRLNSAELLEENGYTVIQADNAEEALKVMEARNDVRVLFTDIQMPPGMDGLELARQVHARWPKVLLVLTSGQIKPAKTDIADEGRFIRKPYRAKDLLSEIDDVLKSDK